MAHPPKNLQPFLWSTNVNQLDLKKDKSYIIHQLLLYGTFKELKWLFQTYTKQEIVNVFTHQPVKMYPKEMYTFVKNYLLPLQYTHLDEDKYVTSISGPVKPRATGHFS